MQLDEAFVRALGALDTTSRNDFEQMTFVANEKLVEWEELALGAVVAGKPEQGKPYMFGPEYDEQKLIYHKGLEVINAAVRDTTQTTLVFITNFTVAILVLLGLISPVVIVISLLSYRQQHIRRQQRIQEDIMRREKDLSEELLYTMLPKHISAKLRGTFKKVHEQP